MSHSLASTILARHSVRDFTPDPVPKPLLEQCLRLAQHAPSNSNMQNWRIALASGPARDRIVSALSAAAREPGGPSLPPLPSGYAHFRNDFVQLLYGKTGYDVLGTDPEVVAKRQHARMRNYEFFGAPVCAVITTDSAMHDVDIMCVGMFVDSFVLALTERGLGSCLQVSVTGYEEVLRREFGLEEGQKVLCGMAIGWAREESPVNGIVTDRQDIEECVRFLE